jgi:hypothetical protein
MSLEQITDHADRAVDRLPMQNKGVASIEGLVRAFANQIQDLENAYFGLLVLRQIGIATGSQLDVIGKIVGAPREGLGDDDYRLRIRAQILVNRRSGEIETLLQIARLLIAGTPTLEEFEPACAILTARGLTFLPAGPTELANMLRNAKAAGVRLLTEYFTTDPGDTFTLDGTPAQSLDAGLLAGII